MISAAEARKITDEKVQNIKNSDEFKYAMNSVAYNIKLALRCGYNFVDCGLNALSEDGYENPSQNLVNAVKEEMAKLGYEISIYNGYGRSGYYKAMKITW